MRAFGRLPAGTRTRTFTRCAGGELAAIRTVPLPMPVTTRTMLFRVLPPRTAGSVMVGSAAAAVRRLPAVPGIAVTLPSARSMRTFAHSVLVGCGFVGDRRRRR